MPPLHVIGGGLGILILMHKGFDIPGKSLHDLIVEYRDWPEGFYLIGGDEENPYFSWPIYMIKLKNTEGVD